MAMQLSDHGKTTARYGKTTAIDGKTTAGFEVNLAMGGARGAAAGSIVAQLAAVLCMAGNVLLHVLEKITNAQARAGRRKQMRLVESLPLGNRRQLLLIDCGNQRYLVGAGADSVGSILAMEQGSASGDLVAKGPELVRRSGCVTTSERRHRGAVTEAEPAPWR